ncbi:sulfonate ABC transporter substrate-binding protein [Hansschlegelia plantiphila]|uniref:Putative aliphatic sulfonates-binding protein n=1 Tax=Hansschlegelia plantiphila TaxID=374655 RepID=A0A9W6J294_9HYPH|nr:sulfonate ABC transporter substrate-binding protein [Hansschlegelia plantiphila]GLK67955.1 sulfonate ABC transporter substrate-binding protein [Hansschlegelia plantiphila]
MTTLSRFALPAKLLAAGLLLAGLGAATASAADREIRIGYQKSGALILLKGKGALEERLKPLGVSVKWAEFQFGPPMLEALNAGAIDFATTGESPPVFAQVASPNFAYVANDPPSSKSEALLVPGKSEIKSIAELKGKTVAVAKGSNTHYFLVKALEKGGLSLADVKLAYLAPADARAAFQNGSVDAWAIWDPHYAAAEAAGARTLTDGDGIVQNYQFFLSDRRYVEKNSDIIRATLEELKKIDDWVIAEPKAAAEELSPIVGIPAPLLEKAIARQGFGVKPVTPEVAAQQQKIADTFLELKLLPKPITVSDAIVQVTQ